MTLADRVAFCASMKELAMSYRGRVLTEDELTAYWMKLERYPLEWLEDGMRDASVLYPNYFPSVGQIVKASEHAAEERARRHVSPAMAQAIASGETVCQRCDDTGWVSEARPGPSQLYPAGRMLRYARECPCRASNAIYQARRARESRWTAARARE